MHKALTMLEVMRKNIEKHILDFNYKYLLVDLFILNVLLSELFKINT